MDLQDSVQRSLQNPADLYRFAKIENLGTFLEEYNSCKLLLGDSFPTVHSGKIMLNEDPRQTFLLQKVFI